MKKVIEAIRNRFQDQNGKSVLKKDTLAGLNVALLAFPQGIAYAMIAGLPVHHGVFSAAIGALVAAFVFHSPYLIPGPTNATAFLIFSFFVSYPELSPQILMPLLVLITAIFLMAAAILRLTDLAQYISRSVMVGYLTGAALLIIVNQLRPLFGITNQGQTQSNFVTMIADVAWHIPELKGAETIAALLCIVLYVLLKRFRPKWPVFAITLGLATLANSLLHFYGQQLPVVQVDPALFSWKSLVPTGLGMDWRELAFRSSQLFGVAMGIAFLVTIETSVMSKSLSVRRGKIPQVNRDLAGIGLANLCCAFIAPMPASGSLTRSQLNEQSGAVTRMAGFWSGLFTLFIAIACGPALQWIPKCALAALVIMIALTLIRPGEIKICLQATKSDAITLVSSFAAAIFLPLHIAIFVGVGVSIALYLKHSSRPEMVEYDFNPEGQLTQSTSERNNPAIAIVHIEGALFFGAADMFRSQILAFARDPRLRILILRLKNAHHLDATSVLALKELVTVLRKEKREILVSGIMKEVYRVLRNSGMIPIIGKENMFRGSITNPNLATRNALKRAQEILGGEEPEVRIFYRRKDSPKT